MSFVSLAGMLVLIMFFFIARYVSEKSIKYLDKDSKALLVDAFSKVRIYQSLPIFVVLILYIMAMTMMPRYGNVWVSLFAVFYVVFHQAVTVWIRRRLISLKMPVEYIEHFSISRILIMAGFICMILAMYLDRTRLLSIKHG